MTARQIQIAVQKIRARQLEDWKMRARIAGVYSGEEKGKELSPEEDKAIDDYLKRMAQKGRHKPGEGGGWQTR